MNAVHIVTGAAGDIALASMMRLPDGIILACDLNLPRLDERLSDVRASGREVYTMACNITERAQCDALIALASELGTPASLIHLAGVAPPSDPELIHAVNFTGTIALLDACEAAGVTDFVAVCVASLAGHRRRAAEFDALLINPPADLRRRTEAAAADVSPSRLAYAVTKRGVLVQVRARAASWGARNNRLVSVSPGVVADSTMGAARKAVAQHGARAALTREAGVRDMADVITFAAGPQASFLSGVDILIDGGFLALVDHQLADDEREAWHAILA